MSVPGRSSDSVLDPYDDPIILWAAQGLLARGPGALRPGAPVSAVHGRAASRAPGRAPGSPTGRAPGERVLVLACGRSVVVASPDLARRDRLAIAGRADEVVALAQLAISRVGPTYRLFGEAALVRAVAERWAEVASVSEFGWMQTSRQPEPDRDRTEHAGAPAGDNGVTWLGDGERDRIERLLDAVAPGAYARPGDRGVRRWAGSQDANGDLVAVAAEAWSADADADADAGVGVGAGGRGVGFLASVATAPAVRRTGRAAAVCRLVIADLVTRYGTAALMVDLDNCAAVALYHRLGMRLRRVASARLRGAPDL